MLDRDYSKKHDFIGAAVTTLAELQSLSKSRAALDLFKEKEKEGKKYIDKTGAVLVFGFEYAGDLGVVEEIVQEVASQNLSAAPGEKVDQVRSFTLQNASEL